MKSNETRVLVDSEKCCQTNARIGYYVNDLNEVAAAVVVVDAAADVVADVVVASIECFGFDCVNCLVNFDLNWIDWKVGHR